MSRKNNIDSILQGSNIAAVYFGNFALKNVAWAWQVCLEFLEMLGDRISGEILAISSWLHKSDELISTFSFEYEFK